MTNRKVNRQIEEQLKESKAFWKGKSKMTDEQLEAWTILPRKKTPFSKGSLAHLKRPKR